MCWQEKSHHRSQQKRLELRALYSKEPILSVHTPLKLIGHSCRDSLTLRRCDCVFFNRINKSWRTESSWKGIHYLTPGVSLAYETTDS